MKSIFNLFKKPKEEQQQNQFITATYPSSDRRSQKSLELTQPAICQRIQQGTQFMQVIFRDKAQGDKMLATLSSKLSDIQTQHPKFTKPVLRNGNVKYKNAQSSQPIHHPRNLNAKDVWYIRIHKSSYDCVANQINLTEKQTTKNTSSDEYNPSPTRLTR